MIWNTGDPPIPCRTYVCFYDDPDGACYDLVTWTGSWWLGHQGEPPPTAWMFLPDGPTGPGAGQPKPIKVRVGGKP